MSTQPSTQQAKQIDPSDRNAPRNSFECWICHTIGHEEYPDASSYVDESWKAMPDAMTTMNGAWVCSMVCRSQMVFESSTPELQQRLKRFERALLELEETMPHVGPVLEEWEMVDRLNDLRRGVDNARSGIGRFGRRREDPKWITENDAPEEELKTAIRDAVHELDWHTMTDLKVSIDVEHSKIGNSNYQVAKANHYETRRSAQMLATIGNIILRLKEAVAR